MDRAYAVLRRWSWAFAIPMTLAGFAIVVPLAHPSGATWGTVVWVVLSYLLIWWVVWIIGKKGPEDSRKMMFPNER